jgi:hypothetical protein
MAGVRLRNRRGPAHQKYLEHDRMRLPSTAINMLAKTKSQSGIASLPEAITLWFAQIEIAAPLGRPQERSSSAGFVLATYLAGTGPVPNIRVLVLQRRFKPTPSVISNEQRFSAADRDEVGEYGWRCRPKFR